MKTYVPLFIAALLLSACNDRSAEHNAASETEVADSLQPPASVIATKSSSTSNSSWRASVTQQSGKLKNRLKVTGLIKTKEGSPRPTLKSVSKGTPIDISELVLNLSQEPGNAGEAVPVSYEETLSRPDKYKKVTIMYKGTALATINTIESK
jgi:hypothetical protein